MSVGAALSKGYREYKTSDGHRADVVAFCAVPLGEAMTDVPARPAAGGAGRGTLAAHRPPATSPAA